MWTAWTSTIDWETEWPNVVCAYKRMERQQRKQSERKGGGGSNNSNSSRSRSNDDDNNNSYNNNTNKNIPTAWQQLYVSYILYIHTEIGKWVFVNKTTLPTDLANWLDVGTNLMHTHEKHCLNYYCWIVSNTYVVRLLCLAPIYNMMCMTLCEWALR